MVFSLKNKKNFKVSSAVVVSGTLRVEGHIQSCNHEICHNHETHPLKEPQACINTCIINKT